MAISSPFASIGLSSLDYPRSPGRTGRRRPRNRFPVYIVEGARIREGGNALGILWIILIVVLVLALLGFFARGF
ncbi:MAG: hypothetical protein AUG91_06035 [Actinobacteria bacterium 13_1_20CM_4_69_9]|nr:MAG: hypothetical protein AUG91_06035 [Actinobacteria bacterium 13_1_20CM_4_69_9]